MDTAKFPDGTTGIDILSFFSDDLSEDRNNRSLEMVAPHEVESIFLLQDMLLTFLLDSLCGRMVLIIDMVLVMELDLT